MNLSQQLMVMTFMTLAMMVKFMILDMKNLVTGMAVIVCKMKTLYSLFEKPRQRSARPSNIDYILIEKITTFVVGRCY